MTPQLSPELRQAIAASPDHPVRIEDEQTQRVYCERRIRGIALIAVAVFGTSVILAEDFSLPPYDDVVTLPVEVGGESHVFIVDTGASTMFVHSSLRSKLGDDIGTMRVREVGFSELKTRFFESPKMRIGDSEWKCPVEVGCIDQSYLQSALGRPEIVGVLGVPFFESCVIQFDFDSHIVRTLANDARNSGWGTPVNVHFNHHGEPMIDLRLSGAKVETFLVDTGYTGSLALDWSVFSDLLSTGEIEELEPNVYVSISSVREVRRGRLNSVILGEFQHSNLLVDSAEDSVSRIGLGFLRRYLVTFRLNSSEIYFAKGKRFRDPDLLRSLGFGAIRNGTQLIIPVVQADSPGEQAGLMPGDELVKVANTIIDHQSTAEIMWTIRNYGSANRGLVPLTIRRNGIIHEASLALTGAEQ